MGFYKVLYWVLCYFYCTLTICISPLNFLKLFILLMTLIYYIFLKTFHFDCLNANRDLRNLSGWLNANMISLNSKP